MKIKIIMFVLIMFCSVSSCYNKCMDNKKENFDSDDAVIGEKNVVDITEGDDKKMQVNRERIAEALGVKETNRKIRFILSSLNTIQAGQIQSAKLLEMDGEKVLWIVAEDSTDYRIYLSDRGSVEAVKNLNTNEWVIRVER